MLLFLITLFLLYTTLKILLELVEIKFIKNEMKNEPVILEKEAFLEAGNIAVVNKKFDIISLIFEFFITVCWLSFGLKFLYNAFVTDGLIMQNLLFVMSYIVISAVLSLPFDIYAKFIKDKKFGFSTIDAKTFIKDLLKTFALTIVFGSLFVWLLLLCIDFLGEFWWFWAAVLSFVIILLINFIYPTIIAPLFNKMKKLENDDLSASIEDLMRKCGFKSSGIFSIDASKRDNRLNAYFGGLGATKRVVLFDTLIQKLTKDEILAVLGHELGHFKHKDIVKNIIFSAILIFVMFFIFGNLPNSVFEAVGVAKSGGSVIVLLMILSTFLSFIITPLQSFLSRANEFAADKFGADVKDNKDMISALKKLGEQNRAFPKSHKVYSAFYHSHPTLYERICELEKDGKNDSI
ncbi:M48 family metallopeptidase [Campylobacter geochelonis]|uniref:M48 family peptidase n=1 Tax=Campylobacter geochelonis TaxID=1780362 RepID=A0A128EJT1_9BACT|nr:M48 family metallopeptidase [Campylobacter geochelonis]QKF71567.1 peptidase, M48 family [Campylobacter geochelonis]CZE49124.1 M48 family peptidase [Campylobacter geochelonis]